MTSHPAISLVNIARAVYGNRTRLLGLGSRCTTDVLTPQNLNRLQNYYKFFKVASFFVKNIICACISVLFYK